jgi:hypothetical protein
MLWGFYSYAQKKTSRLASEQFKYTYESKSYINGLTLTLYSLVFAFSRSWRYAVFPRLRLFPPGIILQFSSREIAAGLMIPARPFLLDPSRVSIHYVCTGLRFVSEQPLLDYPVAADSGPPST